MPVYQEKNKNKWTKDGRSWYFRAYKNRKPYESKKYFTKKEALEAESVFILKRDNISNKPFHIVSLDFFQEITKTKKESTVYTYKKDYDKLM